MSALCREAKFNSPHDVRASRNSHHDVPTRSCLGSLLAQIRVLPKDPSGGPWGVVTARLTLYTTLYVFKAFLQVLDSI